MEIIRVAQEEKIGMLFIQEPELKSEQLDVQVHSNYKDRNKGRVAFINLAGSRRVNVDPEDHDNIQIVHISESDISIMNIYLPSKMTSQEQEQIEKEIEQEMNKWDHRKMILIMDANSRHDSWSSDELNHDIKRRGTKLKEFFDRKDLQVITPKDIITRESNKNDPTKNIMTTIDLFCKHKDIEAQFVKKSRLMDTIRPDHNLMIYKIKLPAQEPVKVHFWKTLNKSLAEEVLHNLVKSEDVDQLHEEITGNLKKIQETMVKKGMIQISHRCKWWKQELTDKRVVMMQALKAQKEAQNESSEIQQQIATRKRVIEQEYKSLLVKTKDEYYEKIVDDSKEFYKLVNEENRDFGKIIEDEKMPKYLKESFDKHPVFKLSGIIEEPNWEAEIPVISNRDIKKAISKIRVVAAGPNDIKAKMIKTMKDEIVPFFKKLTQRIIETGKYP